MAACGIATIVDATPVRAAAPVRVRVQTELGDIVVEVDQARAPITSANFLKYVDAGHYDGGRWHRTVKMDNQPESTIKIEVIQAGVNPEQAQRGFPAITLERTNVTGITAQGRRRVDGARHARQRDVRLVHLHQRSAVARFRRQRNPDGQGFAAFGRVVSGMDVVRKIQMAPSSSRPKDEHRGAAPDAADQDREEWHG